MLFTVGIQAYILNLVRIGHSMCPRPQFPDLTYMGGTGPCVPLSILFGSVIKSRYISLNIAFGVNRLLDGLKTQVYRFDYYGRYRTLCTIEDPFW